MALKKGINVRHGMQFGEPGATSASELAYDANTTTKEKIDALATTVAGKQDALTFDSVPTDGSNNPVKSNGIYDSEKDIYAAMGEMGAKNLIPYPYTDTTTTINDVTFTDNGDGTITVNGTASANTDFQIRARVTDPIAKLVKNKYILSGAPTGGGNSSFDMRIGDTVNGSWHALGYDLGEGATFELNDDAVGVGIGIRIAKNYFCDNITFKPMLRLASDTDNTYQPYAKTNKQLTDDVALLDSGKADLTDLAPAFSTSTAYTVGQYVSYDGNLYKCTSAHSAGAWAAGDFTLVAVGNELNTLNSKFTNYTKRFHIGEVTAATLDEFVLGVISAISSSIGGGEIANVFAIYPNVNYFMFTILNFDGANYMFTINSTTEMYYGTANSSTSTVSLYVITATAQ